jgi:hypothetical protein
LAAGTLSAILPYVKPSHTPRPGQHMPCPPWFDDSFIIASLCGDFSYRWMLGPTIALQPDHEAGLERYPV